MYYTEFQISSPTPDNFKLSPQLDDVRLTTQASMQRLHSLFNNMNGATKKRAQAKSEADNVSYVLI